MSVGETGSPYVGGISLGVLGGAVGGGGVGPNYTGRMEPLGLRLMGDTAHCLRL